jgi:TolA-binding protein
MNASRLLLLSLALAPALVLGQKREDLASIQRDVASMDDHVKQLQKSFDDMKAAMTALMQQQVDAANKDAAALAALQHSLDQKLADQQAKLVAPVASLGTKVDEMSGDFSAVRENVRELGRRITEMDTKLTDLLTAVRTINNPVTPPPPANGVPMAQAKEGPPAGWSAELAYNTAYHDFNSKKDEQAIEEFAQYVKYAPESENAANAQYYIGQIYYRGEQWEDAVKAFDLVLDKYPPNSKTQESQYMKGCALMKAGHNSAAGAEFKNFIAKYKDSPRARDARAHLVELGMATQPKKRNTKS